MCKKGKSHFWLIEEANGPTSKGRCRWCHEERDFANFYDKVPYIPYDRVIRDKTDIVYYPNRRMEVLR